MKGQVVHIDILGQRYAVRSDLDAAYIAEIAAHLDAKLRLSARELASADPLRVVVLAALNLTDDLFRARSEAAGAQGHWRTRAQAIEAMVDEVLRELPSRPAVNE
jgi:cell division protein ZapA